VIWSSRLVRGMLAAAAMALVPLVAGCEAGASAPTLKWHPPAPGTGRQLGDLTISNAFVLGAPVGKTLPAASSAGLFLAITNVGKPDTLLSIDANGAAASVSLPGGSIRLPSLQSELLTGPQPKIILQNLTHALPGGSVIKLTLVFQNAGTEKIYVPVMPRGQFYSTLSPAPTPSPTVTPSTGRGPTRSPSPGSTKTPGQSQSPSPSAS
jgi:copper(I)-binding protein